MVPCCGKGETAHKVPLYLVLIKVESFTTVSSSKVVLLGVTAAKNHICIAIHVVEGAGVMRHVTSSGTVVKTFA